VREWAADATTIVLVALAIEALLIARLAGPRRTDLLVGLLPGVFLVLGVRFAIEGQPEAMLASLAASLPAHLVDLRRRLRPAAGAKAGAI
jgi:hypothetical protein